jgi:hypothetical protein
VYPDFFGSKRADHSGAIISRIQVAILQEILDIFGWWRKDLVSYRETLRRLPLPVEKRDHWVRLLARAKRDLYQDRAIRLVDKLADYIENTKNIGSGTTLYGVDDFHTIWEHMLRATLYGVDDGWNSRLPKPILIRKNSDDTLLTRNGMKTDIVLRSDKSLFVLDAKYYLADSESELPGWADISKQLLYEMMLKDTAGSEVNVKNAFVFPAAQDFLSDFDSIEVRTRNFRLPTIKFIYLAIEDVMIRYIENKKVSIIGKLLD